jgi:hypothetical protein
VVHVIPFDSHEAMIEHLRRANASLMADLAPAQQALTFGDHWVQFVDVAEKHFIFGQVYTLAETKRLELEAGATEAEAAQVVEQTVSDLAHGLMYGIAYDHLNPQGEAGHTHLASAWPIEDHIFEAAQAADWQWDRLELGHRLALNIAFIQYRKAN